MLSTTELLRRLARCNPNRDVSEEVLRRAIRLDPGLRPEKVGGAYVWLPSQIEAIAVHLGLTVDVDERDAELAEETRPPATAHVSNE